jgi:hypothetical protein
MLEADIGLNLVGSTKAGIDGNLVDSSVCLVGDNDHSTALNGEN